MKKSTALAAIAASTFVIGAYAEQDHKVTASVAEADEQQSAQSIVDDLGIESGTYELIATSDGSPETWEGSQLTKFRVSRETIISTGQTGITHYARPTDQSRDMIKCSRRMFLLGTATTFAGAYAAACGSSPSAEIAATEIPIGSAKIVDGVIFTQPKEGEFKAYSQTCPHQGNPITEIDGMTATCTAHNTSYNLSDGSVISGPGRDPLEEYEVKQDGSNVTTA